MLGTVWGVGGAGVGTGLGSESLIAVGGSEGNMLTGVDVLPVGSRCSSSSGIICRGRLGSRVGDGTGTGVGDGVGAAVGADV